MSNSQDVTNAVGAIAEMAWIFYTAILTFATQEMKESDRA